MFVGIGFIFSLLTVVCYKIANKRREVWQRECATLGVTYAAEELRKMGDGAPDFRYTL